MRLAALVSDEGQAFSSSFQPRRSSTFINRLLIKEEIEMRLDFFLVAKENAVSFASETRVMDGCASLVEMSCMAARPASQDGNRYPRISRTSGFDAPAPSPR